MRNWTGKCLAVAMLALGAGGAAAQGTVTQPINLTASVASYCAIGATTTGAASTLNLTVNTTTTGGVGAASSVSVGTVLCNKGADVQLSSQKGGLYLNADTTIVAASGLQNFINYSATTTGLPTTQATVTAGKNNSNSAVTNGTLVTTNSAAFSATVGVQVTPSAPGSPLQSGSTYQDTLTLSIIPQ